MDSQVWAKYAAIGAASVSGVLAARAIGCWICGAVIGGVVGFGVLALMAPIQGIVVAGDPTQVRGDAVEP